MKRLVLAASAVILLSSLASAQTIDLGQGAGPATPPVPAKAKSADPFKTEEQKILYALGTMLSSQVKQAVNVLDLTKADYKFFLMGMRDALMGEKSKVDMAAYGPKISEFAQGRMKVKADKEKQKSTAFLDKMSKEPGAEKSPSGLIYFEVKAGTGASPAAADSVKAFYKGTLIDGTVFDASAKHGDKPLEFPLDGVIPCWTEGIQKMKVGGKAKLICPSDIAYGDRGQGAAIPGGATLIFEVELAEVVKKEQPKEASDVLAKMSKEPGVQKFPSGLIYKEIKAGTGPSPKAEDTVKVHYTGTLTDGKVFDSSVQRGQPAEFPLRGVIPCWTEGIPKMKVGGKAKLTCPASIAYGAQGRPGIPGGATLIFEVELLDIIKR